MKLRTSVSINSWSNHATNFEFVLEHSIAYTYRVAQKSVNLKHSLVITGMFRFKPATQFVERYHSGVSCAMNSEDLISNNFRKFSK
jgi:hypothetical protein